MCLVNLLYALCKPAVFLASMFFSANVHQLLILALYDLHGKNKNDTAPYIGFNIWAKRLVGSCRADVEAHQHTTGKQAACSATAFCASMPFTVNPTPT